MSEIFPQGTHFVNRKCVYSVHQQRHLLRSPAGTTCNKKVRQKREITSKLLRSCKYISVLEWLALLVM